MTTSQPPLETISLSHKPGALISYQFVPGKGPLSKTHLTVLLNGLIMPKKGWEPAVHCLIEKLSGLGEADYPSVLAYDRYGQGESARDPSDNAQNDFRHDPTETVRDLNVLIHEIWERKQSGQSSSSASPRLLFVSNSIGCVLGRLFAQIYPGTVHAILFLDSNMANSDFVSVFPNPDDAGFDGTDLPSDVTVDELREVRKRVTAMFHPSVRNPEGLDRRSFQELLPYSSEPPLAGPGGQGPFIIVAEHDWEVFAEENERGSLKCPKSLVTKYLNPAWRQYNEGLVHLAGEGRGEGPVTAWKCGHFIQRDDPQLVAGWTWQLIQKLR